jgi:hypothetical protein
MNVGTVPKLLPFANSDSVADAHQYKVCGIEFRRFFDTQHPDSLRFMTALRMNATFPYITPNVMLPSTPNMAIMDAGLADNFGIGDAVHFTHIFREWISENTSGVILVSIRGLPREEAKDKDEMLQPVSQWWAPISGLIGNLFDLQDIDNETEMAYISTELGVPLHTVNFEYINALNKDQVERAAVSWRLTEREQRSIVEAITSEYNQTSLKKLKYLIERKP